MDYLGGALAGSEQAFLDAGEKYGVDPHLLMAISAFETGNGTSKMVQNKNNVAGLYDSKAGTYRSFPSVDASIDFMARNLKKNYFDQGLTTIPQIAAKYAPVGAKNDPNATNNEWPNAVSKIYANLKGSTMGDGMGATQFASRTPQIPAPTSGGQYAFGTGSNLAQMGTVADYAAAKSNGNAFSGLGNSLAQVGQAQARQGEQAAAQGMSQALQMLSQRRSAMSQYLPPISGGYYS